MGFTIARGRCSDSLSPRAFPRLESRARAPRTHSWLSKTRPRLPHEVHAAVFDRVLARIVEPKRKGLSRRRGDEALRRAVTNDRARLKSGVAREAFKLRAEIVERSFAHNSGWIAAVCGGPGFGAARTCASDTCSRPPATTSVSRCAD